MWQLLKKTALLLPPVRTYVDEKHSLLAQNDALQEHNTALQERIVALQEQCDAMQRRIDKAHCISNGTFDVCLADSGFFVVLDTKADDVIAKRFRDIEADGYEYFDSRVLDIISPASELKPRFFLDLGANIGAYSFELARRGWCGYAFEASVENARLMQKSIYLNGYDIRIFDKAVSDFSGKLVFFVAGPGGFVTSGVVAERVGFEDADKITEVPCIALDDMLESEFSGVKKIDFIKMDVEGSEAAALRGMRELLRHYDYPPIYMEVNAWTLYLLGETPKSLLETAHDIGYAAYEIDEGGVRVRSVDTYHKELCQDVLLLKDIPNNVAIGQSRTDDFEGNVAYILERLNMLHIPEESCRIYYLKDYPQYYNDMRIRKRISELADIEDNFFVEKALERYGKSQNDIAFTEMEAK